MTAPELTPEQRQRLEREVQRQVRRFREKAGGVFPRRCPLCGYEGLFSAFGTPPRFDARCLGCNSLERHRLIALYLERSNFLDGEPRLLHFAPEAPLAKRFRQASGRYETADLSAERTVTHRINIEETGLPDESFDRIVCNHVLEHVDDERALAEIFRMLRPGGKALLSTPICEGWAETWEDPEVTSREGRLLNFGQADHVRLYGRDLRDRIRAAGFELDEVTAVEPDVRTYGLMRGETLFIATRPAGSAPHAGGND